MKKNIKCAFVTISTICCLCFIALTLFACDLYRKTEDAYYGYSPENAGEYNVINKAEPVNGDVTNPVVVICFADESADSTRSKVNSELRSFFVGEDNSLKDYYDKVSYGNIGIDTIFPDAEGEVFVYRSDKPRSYYKAITDASGTKRYANESALLNAAIKAADEYFDYSGKSLDVNGDGYVDSVSFLVSGKDSDGSGWGGLLWPHSWELAEISRLSSTTAEKLNNITVNKFTLNFLETVDVGFLCHEAGHVFGMPDLYHYDYDKNYIQVGQWDIMHLNNEIPQYPSVYIRDKYLRSIGDNQIKDLNSDGAYSLKPVTTATAEDVAACRIKISDSESIYMEYRNNGVSTYDSMLSGSGLIVYRVNNTVTGNTKGRYRNSRYPDELYVYRPTVATGGDLRSKELKNLSYAYLSADNAYFNNVGSQTSTKSYDENAIYLTDGKNTGIILKITAQSDEAITFEVGLNGYGSEKVTDLFVEGNTEINYGEPLDITVKIKTSGYDGYAVADPSRYTVQYDPEKIGVQTATVVYTDESGGRIKYNFNVTIKDMPTVDGFNLATGPTKTVYAVGEKIDLSGLSVAVEYKKAGAVEIKYSQSEDYRWETEGADTTRSGVYEMKITYLPFGRYVTVTIKVVSELVSLSASDKDSLTVVGKNENLTINVVGVYEDGTTKKLTPDEYETTPPDYGALYSRQQITIRSVSSPDVGCQKEIIVVDENELTSVSSSGSVKTVYNYGEELSLEGGELTFDFSGRRFTVPAENYLKRYAENYSPTKRGLQELSVNHYGVINTYTVNVLTPDGRALTSVKDGVAVNGEYGYVLFDSSVTFSQATEAFGSYLHIRFVKISGGVKYEINVNTYGDEYLSDGIAIELTNGAGLTVMRFRIYIKGDANGDGKVDASDEDGWAEALFKGTGEAAIYLDMNGDGKYTLTDYALLCSAYGGQYA